MTDKRKRQLRSRYLQAQAVIDHYLDKYNCGVAMLRYINPAVAAACREQESIGAEVRQAIAEERCLTVQR